MEIVAFLESRCASERLTNRFRSISDVERDFFSLLIEQTQPSANALSEIVELIDEITKIEDSSAAAIVTNQELFELLKRDLGRKDKLKLLRKCLEQRRFPERVRIERELRNCVEILRKSHGIKLELPQELEGDSITLTLRAKSTEDFSLHAEKLSTLAKDPHLTQIFKILMGDY